MAQMRRVYDDRAPEQLPSKSRTDSVGYSLSEVAKHATPDDAWIVVNSFVYNITNFVRHHPGWKLAGQTSTIIAITRNLGKDCTEEFMYIHGRSAKRQLEDYMIGYLDQEAFFATSVDTKFAGRLARMLPCLPAAVCVAACSLLLVAVFRGQFTPLQERRGTRDEPWPRC
eukprot:TRINITY_DN2466_c0_g5_i1.p1 TRINITY_DN2466_c0_g5~~TRINITY_DN2466_c0_g5_i1.p1  ORF type:complete len:170 (+),score=18.01 TRINITY_DN2466_c0_g5_i1:134-643(+)